MSVGAPLSFEDILSAARSGGWDMFEDIDPRIRKAIGLKQALDSDRAKQVAAGWAKMAADPDQRAALEELFNSTVRRATFFVQLGLTADQVGTFGAFREGQNAVAWEIARQVAAGLGEPLPKPRDT